MEETRGRWLKTMAERMVCEIASNMSGVHLSTAVTRELSDNDKPLAGVYARVGGDYTFQVQFLAEENLFVRLAKNLMGDDLTPEDVQDYAVEFFNTLCGRFISEIINETHIKARLLSIRYELPPLKEAISEETEESVAFTSEMNEYAVFAWASQPV